MSWIALAKYYLEGCLLSEKLFGDNREVELPILIEEIKKEYKVDSFLFSEDGAVVAEEVKKDSKGRVLKYTTKLRFYTSAKPEELEFFVEYRD